MKILTIKSAFFLMSAASFAAFCLSANAATFIDLGHAAGAQCTATGVNDSGLAVGNCSQASTSVNNAPWVANITTAGPQQPLAAMAAGQPCEVNGLSNAGLAVGSCKDASNVSFATVWSAATPGNAPLQLNPLPGTLLFPLLRPADKSTTLAAFTQQGDILGSSLSANDVATVVFYNAGNATPIRVSNWGDNCVGVDVINRGASIAMNCPNSSGIPIGQIAQLSGSNYSTTTLALPSGATNCTVSAINDQLQIVGACYYPNTAVNVSKTAYWATPSSSPLVLTLSSGSKNRGMLINNSGSPSSPGRALVVRQDEQGRAQYLIWLPLPTPIPAINFILPPAGSVWTEAVSMADNNIVVLNSTSTSQYPAGCTWDTTNGTQCLAPIGGGLISRFTSISRNGSFAVGDNVDNAQAVGAAATTLP